MLRVPGFVTVAILATGQSAAAWAQTPPTEPVAVVRAYVAAQNAHQMEPLLTLIADTLEIRVGLGSGARAEGVNKRSHEQLRAQFEQAFRSQPDARFEILEILSEGSLVITKERVTGLTSGGAQTGISIYRLRNGRVDALWVISPESMRR